MDREEILKKAFVSKETVYETALTYIGPDDYQITIVKSSYNLTRKQMEDMLVERVLERYQGGSAGNNN